jgi:hypothetical protein
MRRSPEHEKSPGSPRGSRLGIDRGRPGIGVEAADEYGPTIDHDRFRVRGRPGFTGELDPSPVFGTTFDLAGVPDGYVPMSGREALKAFVGN